MSAAILSIVLAAMLAGGSASSETKSLGIPAETQALLRAALGAEHEGRLDEARAQYELALQSARALGDRRAEALVLRHRAITALHQYAFDDAAAYAAESVRLLEAIEDARGAALSRLQLALARGGQGDHSAADRELAEAERALDATDDDDRQFARLVRARFLVNDGRYREALSRLAVAESYYRTRGKESRLLDTVSLKAYALQQLGEWQAAKDAYYEVLDVAFRRADQQQVAYSYCNLGEVEQQLGYPDVASDLLDRSIDMLDVLRARIPGGTSERAAFFDVQVDAYHRKIALLVDAKRKEEAFEVAERFHSKGLLEALASPLPALPAAEADAIRTLIQLQGKRFRTGLSDDETRLLGLEEERWAGAERELRRDRAPSAPAVARAELSELQRVLPPDTAMLAYWVHPRGTMLWILRSTGIELVQIPLQADRLERVLHAYAAATSDRTRADDVAVRGEALGHLAAGAELHRLLVAPARRFLDGVKRLIILPDSFLWYLPFDALVTSVPDASKRPAGDAPVFWEYAAARYLGDDYTVVVAPSATAWMRLKESRRSGSGFVAFAPSAERPSPTTPAMSSLPPLPSARAESTQLATLFPSGTAFVGDAASETRFRASAPRARYVHLAAHGYLHREHPELSGVVLSVARRPETGREDGILQAHEVERLHLDSELVSLAACDSGLGQFSRGEGFLGLGNAFLTAGARNVLVSRWKVNDASGAALMRRFYGEVARGQSPSGALQRAKQSVRQEIGRGTVVTGDEKISYAQPYFWAGFALVGADGKTP